MRHLWAICAVLLWAGTAGAQTTDIIGDSATHSTYSRYYTNQRWGLGSYSYYTASTGDTVTKLFVRCSTSTVPCSIEVAIYSVNAGDSLEDRIVLDTIVKSSVSMSVDSGKAIASGLVSGTNYGIATSPMNVVMYYNQSTVANANSAFYSTAELTDPYGERGTASSYKKSLWGRVTQYGAASSGLPIGTIKIGVTELATPE